MQVEHLGTVSSIAVDENGCTLTIADAAPILGDCHIGDSIAVNGACLTVTEFDPQKEGGWFKVWLANETLQRTDLGVFYVYYSPRNKPKNRRRAQGRGSTKLGACNGRPCPFWWPFCPGK